MKVTKQRGDIRLKTHKKRINLDLEDIKKTAKVGKALSSEMRLHILKYLIETSANISEIAKRFHIPQSSAALHVKALEEAGMINTYEKPGVRGSQKVCGIIFEDIYLNAFQHKTKVKKTSVIKINMPIGNYFDCEVSGNCGLVSEKNYLGVEDSPSCFYCNNRNEAQLLWFNTGYVEYRFPTYMMRNKRVEEISFSFEICSEAPGYQNDWPSDVTVWINGKEVDTILLSGDFGGRRGTLNPEWWGESMTQYGLYKSITVKEDGCYENEDKCSECNLDMLQIANRNYISLKLGVKADAKHVGGLNLFGEKFGDYAQNILMKVKVFNEKEDK